MLLRRFMQHVKEQNWFAVCLELVVVILGILLALAADRWNESRLDSIETQRIIERLKSDTLQNLEMFERSIPEMERNLKNVKLLFAALHKGQLPDDQRKQVELAISYIDVVPSYPLVLAGYDELVATGRLRQLNDPELIALLSRQQAEYKAAQAVVGYWRDNIQGASDSLDRYVDHYYTTDQMNEDNVGVNFKFSEMVGDRVLKNNIYDAVDIHSDWLRFQDDIYEITQKIHKRLTSL